jgi:hypothetical protein
MHIEDEPLEIVTFGEQEYDEVIEEYEEILVQEDVPEPPVTDFADTAPAQGKPRCITLILQIIIYIYIGCAFTLQEFYDIHMHIYISTHESY